MEPITSAALITGGVAAAQSSGNLYSDYRQRKLTRELNEENAARADYWNYKNRDWSLEDRKHTEQYNSPSQQLMRMKEAGLNPNLLYGKFEAGQTQMARGTNPVPYEKKMPEKGYRPIDLSAVGNIQGISQMVAQQAFLKEELRAKQIQNQRDNLKLREEMDSEVLRNTSNTDWRAGKVATWQKSRLDVGLQTEKLEFERKTREVRTLMEFEKLLKAQTENKNLTEFSRNEAKAKLNLLKNKDEMDKIMLKLKEKQWNQNQNAAWQIFNTILGAALR